MTNASVFAQGPAISDNFGETSESLLTAAVLREIGIDAEAVVVGAQAGDAPETFVPLDAVLPVDPVARLADPVVAGGRDALARHRVEQPHIDPVLSGLEPELVRHRTRAQATAPEPAQGEAGDLAAVALLELVAKVRIVEEVGEVREQVQRVAHRVGRRLHRAVRQRAPPVAADAVP